MERDRIFVRATAFVKDRRISGSPDLCARRFPVRLLTKQIRISGLVEDRLAGDVRSSRDKSSDILKAE